MAYFSTELSLLVSDGIINSLPMSEEKKSKISKELWFLAFCFNPGFKKTIRRHTYRRRNGN